LRQSASIKAQHTEQNQSDEKKTMSQIPTKSKYLILQQQTEKQTKSTMKRGVVQDEQLTTKRKRENIKRKE
jgi:hypothetical protein